MAKKKRGFAAMDKNRQREIASEGGKASGVQRRNRASSDYLESE